MPSVALCERADRGSGLLRGSGGPSGYLAFVEDGGYGRRELWSPDAWAWRHSDVVERPLYNDSQGVTAEFNRNVLRVVNEGSA